MIDGILDTAPHSLHRRGRNIAEEENEGGGGEKEWGGNIENEGE